MFSSLYSKGDAQGDDVVQGTQQAEQEGSSLSTGSAALAAAATLRLAVAVAVVQFFALGCALAGARFGAGFWLAVVVTLEEFIKGCPTW